MLLIFKYSRLYKFYHMYCCHRGISLGAALQQKVINILIARVEIFYLIKYCNFRHAFLAPFCIPSWTSYYKCLHFLIKQTQRYLCSVNGIIITQIINSHLHIIIGISNSYARQLIMCM